jgi:hypothetical protein
MGSLDVGVGDRAPQAALRFGPCQLRAVTVQCAALAATGGHPRSGETAPRRPCDEWADVGEHRPVVIGLVATPAIGPPPAARLDHG